MRATIIDIKNRTGLSLATISKYLNGGTVRPENKIKIDEAVSALHYQVNENARSLVTNKTRTIGVIVYTVENLYAGVMLHYIGEYFRQYGYGMFICDSDNDPEIEAENIRTMVQKNVDGIIIMPVSMDGSFLKPALDLHIPIVCLDRKLDTEPIDSVTINNRETANALLDILYRNGHRKIAYIGSDREYTGLERVKGFRASAAARSLVVPPSYEYLDEMTLSSGYKGMKKLLSLPERPTAVLMSNYEITLGAIMALHESPYSYPDDISIVAFDNLMLSDIVIPRITISVQPMKEMAVKAAEILLFRIDQDSEAEETMPIQHIVLPTTIHEYDSVKSI